MATMPDQVTVNLHVREPLTRDLFFSLSAQLRERTEAWLRSHGFELEQVAQVDLFDDEAVFTINTTEYGKPVRDMRRVAMLSPAPWTPEGA